MPLKIIYLDDEPDLCDIFSEEFSSDEVKIRTYTEVDKALADAQANPPDLIFLDYRLPGTNGDEVGKKLSAAMPKVLITGDTMVETECPFVRILAKPFNFAEIHEVIATFQKK